MTLLDIPPPSFLWYMGVASNALAAVLFLTLGTLVLGKLHRSSQLTDNPLGSTTGFIFVIAAGSHAVHAATFIGPGVTLGLLAAVVSVDLALVATIVVYLLARRRHGATAAIYEDLEGRRRALELNDAVVQRLAEAKLALDLGHVDAAYEAVGSSLEQSKRICNDMIAGDSGRLRAERRRT